MKTLDRVLEEFYQKVEDGYKVEHIMPVQADAALDLYNYLRRQKECSHPRNKRTYIRANTFRCNLCGKEMK